MTSSFTLKKRLFDSSDHREASQSGTDEPLLKSELEEDEISTVLTFFLPPEKTFCMQHLQLWC